MPREHSPHHEIDDIELPIETYGFCEERLTRHRCETVGPTLLADGLCMMCWDKTINRKDNEHKRSYERAGRVT